MAQARTLALLSSDWTRLVGDAAAAHCTPTVLHDSVLTISVDHPAWATQLTLLGPAIVARCAQVLGNEAVTAVKVHVRG
jgi:predicted nucleic acid-binding Zn ribbon protein